MPAFLCGGDKRIRTAGLLVANEALYQLSHTPDLLNFVIRARITFLLYNLFTIFSTVFITYFLFW